MTKAQGIILGSPVYFQDVTAEMKALIDRAGFVGLANGKDVQEESRRGSRLFSPFGGHEYHRIDEPPFPEQRYHHRRAAYPAWRRRKGTWRRDDEGMQIATTLGRRMAWMLKKLNG